MTGILSTTNFFTSVLSDGNEECKPAPAHDGINLTFLFHQSQHHSHISSCCGNFSRSFRPINPIFVSATDTKLASAAISKVLDEEQRKQWESVPNRHKPFTLELQNAITNLPSVALNPLGLDVAMSNWTLRNLRRRCCRGILEWAPHQTSSTRQQQLLPVNLSLQSLPTCYTFTLQDFECSTASSSPSLLCPRSNRRHLSGKSRYVFRSRKMAKMVNGNYSPEICQTQVSALLKTSLQSLLAINHPGSCRFL